MPAFQPINLEPEDNVDEQVDTTKELHVDEALKRFQAALKLHAQGPRSRDAAAEAYDDLFDSEIFDYREAKTDYERAEQQANGRPDTASASALDIDAGGADGVAASLSQALYMSYKNHGQFYLDKLKDLSRSDPDWSRKVKVKYHGTDDGGKVLDNWTAALDQDPSDPELWRKAARFAGAINSGRIKRYCLEAAVELDDDPAIAEIDPPSLAEGMAGQQLKNHLGVLDDKIALSHPAMAPWVKREMPELLKRHLDPIPFLPDPTSALTPPSTPEESYPADAPTDKEKSEDPKMNTWADLGIELMKCIQDNEGALRACRLVLEGAERAAAKTPEGDTIEVRMKDKGAEAQQGLANKEENTGDAKGTPKDADADTKSVASRKRTQSAAGLEGGDDENGAEKRSKRLRRRTEATLNEEITDPSALISTQLQPYQEVDRHLFLLTKTILENLGVEDRPLLDCVQDLLDNSLAEERSSKMGHQVAQDLHNAIADFDEKAAKLLLTRIEKPTPGLSSFLEHSSAATNEQPKVPPFDETAGLLHFSETMDRCGGRITSDDVVFQWVKVMSDSYATSKWSDTMKVTVVQMLNRGDTVLSGRITAALSAPDVSKDELQALKNIIPMLLELHVDIYERITNPSSVVDYATRAETKYRLGRWLDAASAYLRLMDLEHTDELSVRFLWASVRASSLADNPVREHILLLWTSMREFLTAEKVEPINLPNNVVMPTISPEAAEREISKLTTMDFFLGLFKEDMKDAVEVIETLEPVLNPASVCVTEKEEELDDEVKETMKTSTRPISENANQGMKDLWKFLDTSSTELRLFLWTRLGQAYGDINYPTKRFSCYLKSIEMVMSDFEGDAYIGMPSDSRKHHFMRMLNSLDELVIHSLSMALNERTAFDIIDEEHLKASTAALAKLCCFLHVASLCEDEHRFGITKPASTNSTYSSLLNKLREMQARGWSLLFTLVKAGLSFIETIAPENDLSGYLAAIHRAIGLRKFCKSSNKIFLKVMRMELLKMKKIETWEDHLEQVLYDLYGLKLGVGLWECQEHGCPYEKLEKRPAMQLVEKITILANRMTMKDLLKSDLQTTIDHIQQSIGQTKSTPQMIHNLRNFTEMLKKPIHPLRLRQALSGNVAVDAVSVNVPEAAVAKHGWFFLLGMLALTKFKGVDLNRRQTPGATDDLRMGATFLRLQLQFTSDQWDAWFRLAECFDYELDEAVLWTADKINKDREELVKFQRNAIHCYTLALSHSRYVQVTATKDGDPLHDLYHKFGLRLYSSSREPFAMEPFQHSDQERFFIENMGSGTTKRILHDEMTQYQVWKLAARLFKMAMERNPKNWKNPFMLAKCYWKMFQTPEDRLGATDRQARISVTRLLDVLKKSIDVAHSARRSRHSDPILEPHYKIVSVLHKLVIRGDLPAVEAAAILSEQPFGVKFNPDDHFASFSEPKDWEEYVIRNLTKLRDKDKSNWQHRIAMRHANILFSESGLAKDTDKVDAAKAAFAILKENMFTKTMVMNVWKCDAERPGRHHVFTEQYVRFMTKLLVTMDDRANLDLLLRRLRKKGADFYHFTDLWQYSCMAYLKLLRAAYKVPVTTDEAFKNMSNEEFEIISERINEWAAGDGPHIPAFECMKEDIELKRLNGNLMKVAPVDDLLNDCYTTIYLDVAKTLPGLEPSKIIEERNHAQEVAAKLEAVAQAEPKPPSSISNLLNPPSGQDSAAGTATPDPDKAETAPKARKLIGVRRAEVLRKAEQAVVAAAEAPRAGAKSRVGSVASTKRGSHTPAAAGSDSDGDSDGEGPDAQVRREADGDEEMDDVDNQTHGQGSIHESADESDLSDVPEDYDEEVPEGLLLPNFGRRKSSVGKAKSDAEDRREHGNEDTEAEEHENTGVGEHEDEGELEAHVDDGEDEAVDEEEVEDEEAGADVDEDAEEEEDGEEVEAEGEDDEEVEGEVDEEGEEVEGEVDEEGEEGEEADEEGEEVDEVDGDEATEADEDGEEAGEEEEGEDVAEEDEEGEGEGEDEDEEEEDEGGEEGEEEEEEEEEEEDEDDEAEEAEEDEVDEDTAMEDA